MQDRLNFFEPWERPANHENQLTRALLGALRYCPIAHPAWLSLVDAVASSAPPSQQDDRALSCQEGDIPDCGIKLKTKGTAK